MSKTKNNKRFLITSLFCTLILLVTFLLAGCGGDEETIRIDTSSSKYTNADFNTITKTLDEYDESGCFQLSKYEFSMEISTLVDGQKNEGTIYGQIDLENKTIKMTIKSQKDKAYYYIIDQVMYLNMNGQKLKYNLQTSSIQIPAEVSYDDFENLIETMIDVQVNNNSLSVVSEVADEGNTVKYHLLVSGLINEENIKYEMFIILENGNLFAVQGESVSDQGSILMKMAAYNGEISLPSFNDYIEVNI